MFVEADVWNVAHTDQGYAVLIKPIGVDAAVPIFIGQLEAQSILLGMGDIPIPRPNTHELFIIALKTAGYSIEKVEISELKDGVFYSTIYLAGNEDTIELDARPSDSIALAVRAECRIFVSEQVVEEAGVSLNFITEKTEKVTSEAEKRRIELEAKLEEAVKQENYEEAARLRDMLKQIDSEFF
jgi:bifunctional DNase/RNase